MAYNSYFPVGYQPASYQQTYQPATYPQQQNSGIIWVQGESAAKSYPVAPNTSVSLWDSEANVIYIKSADASGMPSMKIVDYTMRDTSTRSPEIASKTDFVTKDELASIQKEIDALKAKIGGKRKEHDDAK